MSDVTRENISRPEISFSEVEGKSVRIQKASPDEVESIPLRLIAGFPSSLDLSVPNCLELVKEYDTVKSQEVMMDKDTVLERLRRYQGELQQRGILHAAVFGSVARGEATEESDLDILIEIDPNLPMDIYAYAGLKRFIADLFPIPTDVVNPAALKEGLRPGTQQEAFYAF